MLVRHQYFLKRETVGAVALLQRFDLGDAPGGVRMIDMILGAVAAPTGRQLHLRDIELFVGERRQGVGFRFPSRQSAVQPLGVIAARKVLAEMSAAAFGSL